MAPVGLQSQCQTPGMECKGLFIWSFMVLVHLSLSSNQGPSGHSQSVWRCFFFSDKPLFSQLKNTSPCSSLPLVSPVSRDLFIITQLIHHLFAEVFDSLILFLHRSGVLPLSSIFSAFSRPTICLCGMGIHETEQRLHLSHLPLYFWCLAQGLIHNKFSLHSCGMNK